MLTPEVMDRGCMVFVWHNLKLMFAINILQVVAQTIRSCLDELPGSTRTQIGFITFDSTIHFYNMKASHRYCYQL